MSMKATTKLKRPLLGAALMVVAGVTHTQAQAQTAAPAPAAPAAAPVATPMTAPTKAVFAIRGFDVVGENPLPEGETTRVLAPFLRSDGSIEVLQKASTALEGALKARGYALHRVVLPPQSVGETVRLEVVKFVIGKITIEGAQQLSEQNIRRSLPELQEGQAPNFKTLAVQTTIANENPGKQVTVSLKEAEEADRIDARIQVRESKPWTVSVGLSNTGSRANGRDRLTVAGTHHNLFDLDHQFTGAYTTSLERLGDVRQFGGTYSVPLYRLGGVLAGTYTRSTVVGNFGGLTSTGAGQTMGLNYSQYLAPEGGYRAQVVVGLDDKRFDAAQLGGVVPPGQLTRRSRPLSVGYRAKVESDNASLGYEVDLSMNLGGGGGNSLAAYQSEDARIRTTSFKVLRANVQYLSTFGAGWLWTVKGQAQYSADALISGEQFGLGGSSSVRGTGERPLSADRGLLGSVELSTPELMAGLRLSGFVDAGWLRNNVSNGTTKPSSDALASVGLGLRYNVGNTELSAQWGRIVNGSVLAGNPNVPNAPRAGDVKLHFNLSTRF